MKKKNTRDKGTKKWEDPERYYDKWDKEFARHYKNSKRDISGQWEKYGVKYLRHTVTGQIINKEDGKMVCQVFLDSI